MGYLDFYKYQAKARGVHSLHDVQELARSRAYLYSRILLPWLLKDKSRPIAEVACGHGSFLYWLKQAEYTNITGVDSSPEQIERAREISAQVKEADALKWLSLQPDGSQAVIVAIDFIEHISKDDFMNFLASVQRVLSKGGRLILRYPNGDSPLVGRNLFNDITHIWTYTENCINTLVLMHGFAGVSFIDESEAALRDHRWIKVPLCRLSTFLLRSLFRAATKEDVPHWSPHIWACVEK